MTIFEATHFWFLLIGRKAVQHATHPTTLDLLSDQIHVGKKNQHFSQRSNATAPSMQGKTPWACPSGQIFKELHIHYLK